jgi:hypothetical protein
MVFPVFHLEIGNGHLGIGDQTAAEGEIVGTVAVSHQSEGADLLKAIRQHVEQESREITPGEVGNLAQNISRDELLSVQRHLFELVPVAIDS